MDLGLPPSPPVLCRGQELLPIERHTVFQHVVDRPCQLVGQNRQRFPLAMLSSQLLHHLLARRIVTQKRYGRFGESPLQMGIADLGAAVPLLLAGRLVGTLHQPAVGREVLHRLEAVDVVDLVEQHHGQDLADTVNRAEEHQRPPVLAAGGFLQLPFQGANDIVIGIDHRQVDLHDLFHLRIGKVIGNRTARSFVGHSNFDFRQIVLDGRTAHMAEQIGPAADQEAASAQQIAGRPHLGWIDIGHGKHATTEQTGNLLGIDLVVLYLAAVYRLHVQGMAEDEIDLLPAAEIGQPVPGEHALHADHQVVPEGPNDPEEIIR